MTSRLRRAYRAAHEDDDVLRVRRWYRQQRREIKPAHIGWAIIALLFAVASFFQVVSVLAMRAHSARQYALGYTAGLDEAHGAIERLTELTRQLSNSDSVCVLANDQCFWYRVERAARTLP